MPINQCLYDTALSLWKVVFYSYSGHQINFELVINNA